MVVHNVNGTVSGKIQSNAPAPVHAAVTGKPEAVPLKIQMRTLVHLSVRTGLARGVAVHLLRD